MLLLTSDYQQVSSAPVKRSRFVVTTSISQPLFSTPDYNFSFEFHRGLERIKNFSKGYKARMDDILAPVNEAHEFLYSKYPTCYASLRPSERPIFLPRGKKLFLYI